MGCLQLFDWRSVNVNIPAPGTFLQAFPANARRLSLIFAVDTNAFVVVANGNGGFTNNVFAGVNFRAAPALTYRDFGPVIQQEIWVSTVSLAGNVRVTEVFPVGA